MNATITKKQAKRTIESITIKHILDDDAATSYLGKYGDYEQGAIKRDPNDVRRNDYAYFIPGMSYKDHYDGLRKMGYSKGEADYLARSYTYQDYRRMERLNRGDWLYMGIEAEAMIKYPIGGGNYRLQRFTSGGLWGIESDSGDDYITEVENDQLFDLKAHLETFGVNVRNFDKIEVLRKEF